jgi:hypothetical protein
MKLRGCKKNTRKQKTLLERKLSLIKQGAKFGYPDIYGGYFPLELVEVVDEQDCMVKVFERSINQETITSTFGLVVMDGDKEI